MTTEVINIQVREDGSRVVSRNIENIGKSADSSASLVRSLQGVLLTIASGATLAGILRLVDTYTTLQNRLRLVTSGTSNLKRVTQELLTISNQTRSDFDATAQLYSRMAASSKDLGLSQQQLLSFTKSLNQAIILSGASAEEAAGGLRQLSQGIASGTLRGDELNSVLENFPKVADVIAESMGKSRGELRKMGQEGKITALQIIDAFAQASQKLDAEFATTVPTIGQSFTVLKNNLLSFIGQLNQSTGFGEALSRTILKIANNLDTLLPILGGVAAAVAFAFAPAVIAIFAEKIAGLWGLLKLNPMFALATAVVGVSVALFGMRDQIKLGIDETTTLGDLLRAAWEQITPIIDTVAGVVEQVFINFGLWSGDTYKKMTGDADNFGKQSESRWLSMVRVVARVIDAILGLFIGMYEAIKNVFDLLKNAVVNNVDQIVAYFKAAKNLDLEGMKAAAASNLEGWKNVWNGYGEAVQKGLDVGFAAIQEGGFEAKLDKAIARAQEIGKLREAAAKAQGDLTGATGGKDKPAVVDEKALRELERLKNALRNVKDEADPVGATVRRLAEAEDILTKSVVKNLIDAEEARAVYSALTEVYKDQLRPLDAVNREIDKNIEFLKMSNRERQVEADLYAITERLKWDGKKLTEAETEALRAKLVVEQELNRISQARDQVHDRSSVGQMEAFTDQLNGLLAEMQSGSFQQGDTFGALTDLLPWANLENSQMQMDMFVQMHADMYAQIKALEEASVVDHKTAELLKAQADAQFNQMRLKGTMDFFGQLATLSNSSNKKLAAIGKAAAITQAVMKGYLAIQEALAAPPGWPYNAGNVVAVTAMQAANVAAISSQSLGFRTGGEFTVGGSGAADSQMVSFRATPGERVRIDTPRQVRKGDSFDEQGGDSNVVRPNLNVVVLQDPSLLGQYLQTPEGEEALVVALDRNGYQKR